MPKKTILSKLIHEHRNECTAVERVSKGIYTTPWNPECIRTEWRDKSCGLRGKNAAWLIFKCQDNNCGAEIAILSEATIRFGDMSL